MARHWTSDLDVLDAIERALTEEQHAGLHEHLRLRGIEPGAWPSVPGQDEEEGKAASEAFRIQADREGEPEGRAGQSPAGVVGEGQPARERLKTPSLSLPPICIARMVPLVRRIPHGWEGSLVSQPDYQQRVVVTDFDMSFGNMVGFMVKATIAAIPAAIILGFIAIVAGGFLAGLVGVGSTQ